MGLINPTIEEEYKKMTDKWHAGYPQTWFDIPRFKNYRVNYKGRVKNRTTKRILKWIYRNGRPCVNLCKDGKQSHHMIAHLVLEATGRPRRFSGNTVVYRDGDSNNCHFRNLNWRFVS